MRSMWRGLSARDLRVSAAALDGPRFAGEAPALH